jgi:tetratricopeptide (TPR) repeat protein
MRRVGWVTLVATSGIAFAGVAVVRGATRHAAPLSAATDTVATKTESEVRSLDIEFYERRAAEDPFSAADRSRLASLYMQRARETGSYGDYERAAVLARESLGLREAHNASTYVVLASALLAKHEFREALGVAKRLYDADTTDASHAALLAEVELEIGDYESAARHFSTVVRHADQPSVAARLARWYEVTGQLEKARALLRQSSARMVNSDAPREQVAWFQYRLGELHLRSGQLDAADSAFNRALAALPTDYRAFGALARSAAARGDWPSVVRYGERSIAIQLDPATLGTMSEAFAAIGDTAQARSFADAMAVSALSQPGAIHRQWGLFLLDHERDVARVLRDAGSAIGERRDVYGYDLLAWASYKAGDTTAALHASRAAVAQGTEDARLLHRAAVIARASGDSASASALFAKAHAVNPRFGPAGTKTVAGGAGGL